jgi:predicted nuclease of restriction endonuclease-like RecB superfamily
MEEVVKLFSTAFKQICEVQQVDKLTLERFRIIFQAAKDYGPLLSSFQRWEKIEKQVEELAAAVAELQAAKGVKKV